MCHGTCSGKPNDDPNRQRTEESSDDQEVMVGIQKALYWRELRDYKPHNRSDPRIKMCTTVEPGFRAGPRVFPKKEGEDPMGVTFLDQLRLGLPLRMIEMWETQETMLGAVAERESPVDSSA
jgi:hypothetical protein